MRIPETRLRVIADRFALPAAVVRIEPLGQGLINATFRLTTADGRHRVLQRLNPTVFADPAPLMANLRRLAELGRAAQPGDPRIPGLIPTRDGADWLRDDAGAAWRLLEFIPDGIAPGHPISLAQARAVGTALGAFHRMLARLPPAAFEVAIPDFHETPVYLARLDAARAAADDSDRAWDADAGLQAALRFIDSRRNLASLLDAARRSGRIPIRAVHGDPKLDNLLFDRRGEQVLALIDLDTVQPGLLLHDIADCLRSCCKRESPPPTDETLDAGLASGMAASDADPAWAMPVDRTRPPGVRFDLPTCRALLGGYAATGGSLLCDEEIRLMTGAIRLLPFELGLRFIADHLAGDRYFRVRAHGENLRRALIQLALVADIECQEPALERIVRETFADK